MASGKLVCVAVDLTEGDMQKFSLKLLQEPLQTVTLFHDPEWRFLSRHKTARAGPQRQDEPIGRSRPLLSSPACLRAA